MNFNELKQKQKAFDNFIIELHSITLTENELFLKKAHSLTCELWEVANELKYFKYWKISNSQDQFKLLEELADMLFFQLSLSNDLDVDLVHEFSTPLSFEERFFNLNKYSTKLMDEKYDNTMRVTYLNKFYSQYIGLLVDLKVDKAMMKMSYMKKYKRNLERQCEGY